MWADYFTIALKLFIIMDAIGMLPVFLLLSEKMPRAKRNQAADKTMVVAGALLFLFVFAGEFILKFFDITLSSFQVAGGLILLLFGLKMVLGLRLESQKKRAELYEFTAVPMATPLIVGPGTITTVLILNQEYDLLLVCGAALLNLFILWIVLRNANRLYKVLGHQGSEVVSRLMGLVLTAWAVDFIWHGIQALMASA